MTPRSTAQSTVTPLPLKGTTEPAPRTPRQVGRPANVPGDETREMILKEARECFAAYGYAATSNRLIAERTGLTSAAVYHHFGRKSDLMRAVYSATLAENQARWRAAIDAHQGIVARVHAILDVTHQILTEDRAQAVFMFIAREEAARHAELAEIAEDRVFADLFAEIVSDAVAAGEIAAGDAAQTRGALLAIASGLASVGTQISARSHHTTTAGLKRLVAGALLPPGT
ncbi:MAG: TetR/AcrR family transcriptional regulator [Solirubrobacteraceae bacterium]